MQEVMTPGQFKDAVAAIIGPRARKYTGVCTWEQDPKVGHGDYDDLLERLLRSLGYSEGIDLAEGQTRWYE